MQPGTFPMPNMPCKGGMVVASTWITDSRALILGLRPQPPFFFVQEFYVYDPDDSDDHRRAGDYVLHGIEHNIVPAVKLYEDCGGDY